MKVPLLISLLLAGPLHATTLLKQEIIGKGAVRYYDLNGDKRPDYIIKSNEHGPVETLEDSNFDGTMDVKSTFAEDAEFYRVQEFSKVGSAPRRRLSFWNDEHKDRTFILTHIDDDNDGTWDREFVVSGALFSHKDDCPPGAISRESENLAKTALNITTAVPEYMKTDFGYRIHSSCIEGTKRDWFLRNADTSIREGLACLYRLDERGGKGAAKNFIALEKLIKPNNIQVICHDTTFKWDATSVARATLDRSSPERYLPLVHPGISFNPAAVEQFHKKGASGELELQRTLFHEQLHNLGHRHNHDLEYAYPCETCCFPEAGKEKAEITEVSCRLCSGNYQGQVDPKYVYDITRFGQLTYTSEPALTATLNYLRLYPGSKTGLAFLAVNLSNSLSPVGVELAKLVPLPHSPEEARLVADARKFKDQPLFRPYEHTTEAIAAAFRDLYFLGDPEAALKKLRTNFKTIQKEFSAKPSSDPKQQYVDSQVRSALNILLDDLRLKGYTGKLKDKKKIREIAKSASDFTFDLETK